jgi:hypothetical protein
MPERATFSGGTFMADHISRGEIISLLAGLPLAVAATTAVASAADDSGGTKAQFKYIPTAGPKGQVCATCASFKPPSACVIVKGKISPKGYCIAYSPKAK